MMTLGLRDALDRLERARLEQLLKLARWSAEEGWGHPLLTFVVQAGRLPTREEQRELMCLALLHGLPAAGVV